MASRFVRSIKNVKNIKNYPVDDNVTEINDIINDEAGNVYIRTAKSYEQLNNGKDVEEVKKDVKDTKKDLTEIKKKQDEQNETLKLHESKINEMQEKLNQIDIEDINKKLNSINTLNTKVNNIYTMTEKDGTRKYIDKPTNVKTLNVGYYELTTNNKPKEYGLPESIGDGFVEVDVLKGKENRTQIYVTKSSNNTSWQKTIHTNGEENDWKKVVE